MLDDGFHSPRTWKWAVPAMVFIVLIPVTGWAYVKLSTDAQIWVILPCGFCALFLFIAGANFWKWATAHKEEMFDMHQASLSSTPTVLLAKYMQQMHPEAVKTLNRFGVRTTWEVRVNRGERDWILSGTNPAVHLGFIEFVLSNSGTSLYGKWKLSEGSKKWDPDGFVEDREQYEELERWMFARLMVTRSHGNMKPAEFIPPWTPELIMGQMGMVGDQDLYRPDEEARKDLGAGDRRPETGDRGQGTGEQKAVGSKQNGNGQKAEEGPELLPEEFEAITKENATYSGMYLKGDSND